MKVLFICHYRELSGYGEASRQYIHAMNSVGIDLYLEAVKFDKSKLNDPLILELENKPYDKCDIVIQYLLPHLMEYDGNFKQNIGMFASETLTLKPTSWLVHLQLMDKIWVLNNMMKVVLKKDGITNKTINVVPHAFDILKYKKEYKQPQLSSNIKDNFKFYFIGEGIHRKNLHTLIKAFHIEFDINEPVSLIIKTSLPGMNANQTQQYIENIITQVKQKLRLYPSVENYHKEILITQRLSEDDLNGLHQMCDCFVMPSYGEAFCIPALEAMGFGNPVIATDTGGMRDYVDKMWLVETVEEPVFAMSHVGFTDLNTSRETWHSPKILDLMKKMRNIYNCSKNKEQWNNIQNMSKNVVNQYSYEKIGNLIKGLLNE